MPSSTIWPVFTTTILDAYWTVHIRCAEKITVLFFITPYKLANTLDSVSISNALVGSSINRIRGLLIRQRAKAILCFWPPETKLPRSPTSLSYSWLKNKLLYYQFPTISSTHATLVYYLNLLTYFFFFGSGYWMLY